MIWIAEPPDEVEDLFLLFPPCLGMFYCLFLITIFEFYFRIAFIFSTKIIISRRVKEICMEWVVYASFHHGWDSSRRNVAGITWLYYAERPQCLKCRYSSCSCLAFEFLFTRVFFHPLWICEELIFICIFWYLYVYLLHIFISLFGNFVVDARSSCTEGWCFGM